MLRISVILVWMLASLALLAGCGEKSAMEKKAHAQEATETTEAKNPVAPANVKTQRVEAGSLVEELLAMGATSADKDVRFGAETAGRVEFLGADLGGRVTRGQILARIDYKMQKAQADQAEALYDLAVKTHERLKTLRDEELISQQQLDEAQAQMVSAEAQVAIARVSLEKSVVRSTTNGVVVEKFTEVGEFVGPGSPLLRVVDTHPIYVLSQVPESQVADVARGKAATVRIEALNETVSGTVDYVLPASSTISRTFTIRVRLDGEHPHILAGMAATVRVQTRTHESAVVIPQEAIVEEGEQEYIFVASDGVARQRAVRTGATSGDRVMVLEGLSVGEDLIVVGQRTLVDGQPLRIVN